MKDFLKKLIAQKEARAKELKTLIDAAQTADEVRSLNSEAEILTNELNDARSQLTALENQEAKQEQEATAQRSLDPLASYGIKSTAANNEQRSEEDKFATMEYRTAFMNYVKTGVIADVLVKRANDQTELSDLGIMIPTTISNEIIKGVEKVYGQLYSKVKKTNFKGGYKIPLGSFEASFTRISETGAPTDRQNGGQITGSIDFGSLIGEVRLAQTLLMSIMGVTPFEQELSKVIVEAYVKAMDYEIMKGDPTKNECTGILTEAAKTSGSRIATTNIIEFTETEMADWTAWQKKLFAIIPLSIRKAKPEFAMTANTFEANIVTLKDKNDQPVAREIYNPVTGDETAKFKGRDVTFVEEDILENFNDAANGEYFAMYWVPDKAYAINSNLEFSISEYYDNETHQKVKVGLVINDGKVLDPKYIYLLKKKVSA